MSENNSSVEREDVFRESLLQQPHSVEALTWLQQDDVLCTISGGDGDASAIGGEELLRYIQNLYNLGAKQVVAVEIDGYGEEDIGEQDTGKLIVELPTQQPERAQLFAFEAAHARSGGYDPITDQGQKYLSLIWF